MRIKRKPIVVPVLENMTIVMIMLVLIQTFMEDFSVYADFPVKISNQIKLSAILFDLFFTIEFIVRQISSSSKKNGIHYFFYRNGWIDLLASIPLLLFISGPEFLSHVFKINLQSIGLINAFTTLKIIKAIRVARILRLLRILKIFGKIKNVQSVTAQRHISQISTIVVSSIIFFFIITSIIQESGLLPSLHSKIINEEKKTNILLTNLYRLSENTNNNDLLANYSKEFNNIIQIKLNNKIKYKSESIDNKKYLYYKNLRTNNHGSDFIEEYKIYLPPDELSIIYWRDKYFKENALNNMMNFLMIIFILIIITLIYSRYFALTISDPVYVMRKGFEQKDYTYAVKLLKHFEDDDIFLLANDYNTRWLPAKIRKLSESGSKSESKLKLEDILKG